jgi:hypothetical protein
MTPRCRDPGVLTPCIVNDFPLLKVKFLFLSVVREADQITLFVHKQILLHYILQVPEKKFHYCLSYLFNLTLSTSGKTESA